ncbi:MAG: beta-lactamase family protein [Ignavibacteriaceae bacterium]|nr:beta-lactamase family protein [Ignavibacteriaceae bacterium]
MKTNNKAFLLLLLLSVYFFSGCEKDTSTNPPDGNYVYTVPEETSDGWSTASLSSVGMNPDRLVTLVNKIKTNSYTEVHSVVIIKNDKLVFEEYFPGHDFGYTGQNYHGAYIDFDRDTRHNTHSATKSFTSALAGIAIDKGFIQSVDDKIFDYFQDYSNLSDQQKEKITIKHLLTMSSGLEWNEWDVSVSQGNHDIVRMNSSSDPVYYVLNKPVVTEPGTAYYYNGGTVDLLGQLIRRASSLNVKSFSRTNLFEPLGITNYNWQTLYPSGITCCHGDIYITPRDMAKFGYLFLKKGMWNGTRVISEEWVNNSFQNHITPPVNWAYGYGYLWWLRRYSAGGRLYYSFNAEGWGGQQIIIIPTENMVVVFTGANYVNNPPNDEIMTSYILPALGWL